MAIEIKNKVNLAIRVTKIVDGMETTLKKELSDVVAEIRIRTASGKTVEGSTFKGYAESTKQQKRGNNKRNKVNVRGRKVSYKISGQGSRQVSPVNLTNLGSMLASFGKVKIEKTNSKIVGIIGFSSKAEAQKGKWNQDGDPNRNRPPRPWVGLSGQQITRLLTRLRGK